MKHGQTMKTVWLSQPRMSPRVVESESDSFLSAVAMSGGSMGSTRVRIVQLDHDSRIPGSGGSATPAVGDIGILIDAGRDGDRRTFIVESVDENGVRVWLAELASDEIELVDESNGHVDGTTSSVVDTGTLITILSLLVGNALSALLSLAFAGGFSPLVSFIAATAAGLFGHLKARSFIDGLRVTAVLGIATWLLLLTPVPLILARIWLSLASGFCAGKTIVGGYRSFRA